MASSRQRATFIRNIQNGVIRNERMRFNETSLFLDELNKAVDDNLNKMRKQYRDLGLRQRDNMMNGTGADIGVKFRMEWIAELGNNIKAMRDSIVTEVTGQTMEHFINTYTKTYQNNIDTFGFGAFFTLPDKRAIVTAINYPWKGTMWSDRVWENTTKITSQLQQEITGALLTGDSYVNVAKRLDSSLVKQGQKIKYVTERIVRTETARIRYIADDKFYKEAKVEQLEFCAIIDSKTSKACRGYDGKIFDLGKEPTIPVHPHCRSTYLPVIPEVSTEEWIERIKEAKALDNPQKQEEEKPIPTPIPTAKETKKRKEPTPEEIAKAKDIADSFSKQRSDVYLKQIQSNLERNKDRFIQSQSRYGEYKEKEVKRFNKWVAETEAMIEKIQTQGGYILSADMSEMKLATEGYKVVFNTIKYDYFEPRNNGTYFICVKDKMTKAEEKRLLEYCDTLIQNNPRLIGTKISVDNKTSEKRSSSRSKNMGFYSPSQDYLNLRDFKGYTKALQELGYKDTDGEKEFLSTLYHELAHRNHSTDERLKDVVLTEEEWGEWRNLLEPLYDKYRTGKDVKFKEEWNRFNYPVNAEDYYTDGDKKHFFQEMWAESQAVIYNKFDKDSAEELKKLNKFFPGVEEFMKKLID